MRARGASPRSDMIRAWHDAPSCEKWSPPETLRFAPCTCPARRLCSTIRCAASSAAARSAAISRELRALLARAAAALAADAAAERLPPRESPPRCRFGAVEQCRRAAAPSAFSARCIAFAIAASFAVDGDARRGCNRFAASAAASSNAIASSSDVDGESERSAAPAATSTLVR